MTAPCKGCKKRFSGCHSSCEDYIDYVGQNEADKEKIRKAREKSRYKTYMPEYEFRKAINRKVEHKVFKQHKK